MRNRWLAPLLAWMLLPIPVVGWVVAQGFTERIGVFAEFTGAYVHTLATSTFAVILAISALITAAIVTWRCRYSPASYARRYPIAQGITIALSLGWIMCVILGPPVGSAEWLEMLLGGLIAASSVLSCVFAARKDPFASTRRSAQIAERSPERRRTLRRAQIIVPTVLGFGAAAGIVLAQALVVVHDDCRIQGTGNVDGQFSFSTESCGDFAVDESRLSPGEVTDVFTGEPVDVTTQGYEFGLPPVPVAIAVRPG